MPSMASGPPGSYRTWAPRSRTWSGPAGSGRGVAGSRTGSGASSTAPTRAALARACPSWMAAAGRAVTASNAARAVSVITASGTRVRAPDPTAATPATSTAHSVSPATAWDSPLPSAAPAAEPRASRVRSASARCAAPGRRPGRRRHGGRPRPATSPVTCAPSSARAARGAPGRHRGPAGGQPGHPGPGHQQPGGQQQPGGGQDDQAGGRGPRADQEGGQRRRHPADEQVLGGVHVRDQPGQQVTGAEFAQPGRGQPLQPLVDPDLHVGEHPERRVVRGEPLGVAEHAPADRQPADGHDGDRDGHDVGVQRGPGEQEPGRGQQGHRTSGGGGAGQHGQHQLPAQGPGHPEQPQQRVRRGRGRDGGAAARMAGVAV